MSMESSLKKSDAESIEDSPCARRLTYKDQLQFSMKPLEKKFIIPHSKSIKVLVFTLVTVRHSTFPTLAI